MKSPAIWHQTSLLFHLQCTILFHFFCFFKPQIYFKVLLELFLSLSALESEISPPCLALPAEGEVRTGRQRQRSERRQRGQRRECW